MGRKQTVCIENNQTWYWIIHMGEIKLTLLYWIWFSFYGDIWSIAVSFSNYLLSFCVHFLGLVCSSLLDPLCPHNLHKSSLLKNCHPSGFFCYNLNICNDCSKEHSSGARPHGFPEWKLNYWLLVWNFSSCRITD